MIFCCSRLNIIKELRISTESLKEHYHDTRIITVYVFFDLQMDPSFRVVLLLLPNKR